MAKRKKSSSSHPRELLASLCWSFTGGRFPSREAFVAAVRQYQLDITQTDDWQPEAIGLSCPRVQIEYEYWDDPFEVRFELEADDPAGFTAGELLHKIHEAVVEQLRTGDHHFFEGLSRRKDQGPNAPPVYEINLGS